MVGHAQLLDDPSCLPVERQEFAGSTVEDDHSDRRGLEQSLHVGPRPPFVPVRACMGDRGGRLRREEHQHLLVVAGELEAVPLLAQKEDADQDAAMDHRRGLHRLCRHHVRREAERSDVRWQVRDPKRPGQVAEVRKQTLSVGPGDQSLRLTGRQAGYDEILGARGTVDRDDHTVARAGKGAGAVDDFLQHGFEVEAAADAQNGVAQPRDALPELPDLSPQLG